MILKKEIEIQLQSFLRSLLGFFLDLSQIGGPKPTEERGVGS